MVESGFDRNFHSILVADRDAVRNSLPWPVCFTSLQWRDDLALDGGLLQVCGVAETFTIFREKRALPL